jgi:hypothetical protein
MYGSWGGTVVSMLRSPCQLPEATKHDKQKCSLLYVSQGKLTALNGHSLAGFRIQ